MRTAGFTPGPNPGHWVNVGDVAVDLMVVPHQAGTTRSTARAARLSPHEKLTARIARGLEPALVDSALVTITALESGDSRTFELRVAGPAALLMAKAIKISERLEQADAQPDRLKEKDALDAFDGARAASAPVDELRALALELDARVIATRGWRELEHRLAVGKATPTPSRSPWRLVRAAHWNHHLHWMRRYQR